MKYVKIHSSDTVAVAVEDLKKDESVSIDGRELTLVDDIPAGHKLALYDIAEGENVIKYAYPIGHAEKNIIQ